MLDDLDIVQAEEVVDAVNAGVLAFQVDHKIEGNHQQRVAEKPPSELENVESFTRTNISKPDFTLRKARKSQHFWHFKPKKQNWPIFYTDLSVISVTFCNYDVHTPGTINCPTKNFPLTNKIFTPTFPLPGHSRHPDCP